MHRQTLKSSLKSYQRKDDKMSPFSSGRLKPWLFPSTGTLLEVQVPTDRMSNEPSEIWPLLI